MRVEKEPSRRILHGNLDDQGTLRSENAEVPGLHLVRQVHGRRVVRVPPSASHEQADALVASEPGTAVGVRTADCVPLLLVDPAGRAVAAVHSGWRGAAARVSEAAVESLAGLGVEPAALVAVIGPHIGPCCYEIDEPVRAAIPEPEVFSGADRPGHWRLDPGDLNRRQLLRAGLRADRIHRVGGCTACESATYASHRRDGSGRRMLHYVRVPFP